jgi:hypothetical protein
MYPSLKGFFDEDAILELLPAFSAPNPFLHRYQDHADPEILKIAAKKAKASA